MKRCLTGICAAALAGGLFLCAGCTGVGYVSGPGVYYDYDYYPDWDVYYYPAGHVYYWNDRGHWRSGADLPHDYHFHDEHHEQFRSHTRQPWNENHAAHGHPDEMHDHH